LGLKYDRWPRFQNFQDQQTIERELKIIQTVALPLAYIQEHQICGHSNRTSKIAELEPSALRHFQTYTVALLGWCQPLLSIGKGSKQRCFVDISDPSK